MLYINKTFELLLLTVLPINVQSNFVQSLFSKIPGKQQLKYNTNFKESNQLQCASLCKGDYFYFENGTCYTANFPMKADNKGIYGRYFVNDEIQDHKDKCMRFGNPSYVFEEDGVSSCIWIPAATSLNWTDANQHCQAAGGSLVVAKTVESLVKFVQTLDLLKDKFYHRFKNRQYAFLAVVDRVWVGCSDIEKEGDWRWTDDTTISLSDSGWSDGEPNNGNGNEHCGILLYHRNSKMNDATCRNRYRFSCGFKLLN